MTISTDWNGRSQSLRQLHQRSSHMENYLPHRAPQQAGEEAAAAGLGHRG
jgi:hypothetical protein